MHYLTLWFGRVETPLTLLQESPEMLLWNTVESAYAALGLIPKVLNPVDVVPRVREAL